LDESAYDGGDGEEEEDGGSERRGNLVVYGVTEKFRRIADRCRRDAERE